MNRHFSLSLITFLLAFVCVRAEEVDDSVLIHFRQSEVLLDTAFMDNSVSLQGIADRLAKYKGSEYVLKEVRVVGAASPEGSVEYNMMLSRRRAQSIFRYLSKKYTIPESLSSFTFIGRDWRGLLKAVEADSQVPQRKEVLGLLQEIVSGASDSSHDNLARLKSLGDGVPYNYLYNNIFPALRASRLSLRFGIDKEVAPVVVREIETKIVRDTVVTVRHDTVYVDRTEYINPPCRPFYIGVKTNMLYDGVLLPNIGVEFYLGKGVSASAQWQYTWLKNDGSHRYWRIYGGNVEVRYRPWSTGCANPLSGHHFGVYGQMLTFDVENTGKGFLAPRWCYAAGVTYGYSLPVSRRLDIDFNIGIGYMHGTLKTYRPENGCYMWQKTKKFDYIGPTNVEVSLVWLIGCDNYNRRKRK